MNDAQKRVLVEAEFSFYLVGYPWMFQFSMKMPFGNRHIWVPAIPVTELQRINAVVRGRLRSGSLGTLKEGLQSAIKPIVIEHLVNVPGSKT